MRLSVIVVVYDAAEYLRRCLVSLEVHLQGVEHEICVVDNASNDGGVSLVRERFPKAKLLLHDRNLGFAAGTNAGLRATSGRFVLWLNPDCELTNGGIHELLEAFEREPTLGVIGPKVTGPGGDLQPSCRSFPSYQTAFFSRQSVLTRLFPANPFSERYLRAGEDSERRRDGDWVSGACLLHRREVADGIGGIDERFFMYCEDVDFCLRARAAGWRVAYHPGLEVKHYLAGSTRKLPLRMIREHHRSMWSYYAKHFPRHPLKDAVVGAAIWGRCGLKLLGERFGPRLSANSVRP